MTTLTDAEKVQVLEELIKDCFSVNDNDELTYRFIEGTDVFYLMDLKDEQSAYIRQMLLVS